MTSSVDQRASPRRRSAIVAALVLGLLPVLRMTWLVANGSPLQYSDYWLLVDEYTYHDGGLRVAGLFDFSVQNHPVVVPMLAYWLDFQLFAGSNIALGGFVIVLGLALIAAVWLLLRDGSLPLMSRLAILVLSAHLLFSANGAWNYVKSMSGTAWLSASLLAVLAIWFRSREWHVPAFIVSAVAVITYATGLMAWTGVVATGVCRRAPRSWWREWPYVVGFGLSYRFYQDAQATGLAADPPLPPLRVLLRGTAQVFGVPLGLDGWVATAVGAAVILSIIGLVGWFAVRGPSPAAAPWAGVAVFGVMASASLAAGRILLLDLLQNRYSSVPSIAIIGLAGLVATVLVERPSAASEPGRRSAWLPVVALCSVATVLAATSGAGHLRAMQQEVHEQELREVALRLDLADGTRRLNGFETNVTALLRANGQYPFVESWDLDCGLLGKQVELTTNGVPSAGAVSDARLAEGAVELAGHLDDPDAADCLVVVGADGTVIGVGTVGWSGKSREDADEDAFVALAPADAEVYRVVAIEDGEPVLVGRVEREAIAGLTG